MKKILLTGFAILSAIGVQVKADTSTSIIEGGVEYEITYVRQSPSSKKDTTEYFSANNVRSGAKVMLAEDIHTITTNTVVYDGTAVSMEQIASINVYNFAKFTAGNKGAYTGSIDDPETSYLVGSPEYTTYFESIDPSVLTNNNIKTYADMALETDVDAYIYWSYSKYTGTVTPLVTTDKNDANLNTNGYYQKYINEDGDILYFLIREIEIAKRYATTEHTLDSVYVRAIDGVANNNAYVQSVSIGKDVTSIAAESFSRSPKMNSFSIQDGNTSFVVENGILYNSDQSIIIAASNSVQSQYIPNSVDSISKSAFFNTLSKITISTMNSGIKIGSNQGSNVEFVIPSANLTLVEDYNGGYLVYGNVTQSNLEAMQNNLPATTTYLDFYDATVMENLDISNPTNVLYFFTTSFALTGNNVVNNDICETLVIKDSERTKRFYSPYSFTAVSASYDRVFDNCWSTLSLPFDVKSASISGQLLCGELKAYNDSHGLFTFLYSTSINANTPYIVKTATNNESLTIQTYNVRVENTVETVARFGHASFICNFDPKVITSNSTDSYFGIKKGTDTAGNPNSNMVKLNGATVNSFRAYLKAPTSEVNSSAAAKIRLVDAMDNEIETIELPYTTAIEKVNSDKAVENTYNLNGQLQKEIKQGLNIVNGKVIINK